LKIFFYFSIFLDYGFKRFGSLGNIELFLMLCNPKNNITTRSKPTPQPA